MSDYFFDYSQYKKRIKHKNSFSFSVIIIIIILLVGAICLIGKPSKDINFYFVQVDNFYKYSDANKLANELQQQNAGGYVYFDGTYHVLACAYINKDDAKTVVNNIKDEYTNATIFTLSCNKFNKKKFSTKESNLIQNIINANKETTEELYNILVKFEENSINLSQLEILLDKLKTDYNKKADLFLTKSKDNSTLVRAKNNILKIKEALSIDCSAPSLSRILKYNLIEININSYSFCSCF